MKILIYGFSVTAGSKGNNYAQYVKDKLASIRPDIEIDIVAIGGVDALFPAFSMREVMSTKHYDYTILDILARGGRASPLALRPDHFMEAYKATLNSVIDAKSIPIVVEFFRSSVNREKDVIYPNVRLFNKKYNITTLDYYLPVRKLGREVFPKLFKDGVHTTVEGSAFYGERLASFIVDEIATGLRAQQPRSIGAPLINGFPLKQHLPQLKRAPFQRGGYAVDCVLIDANESATVNFPSMQRVIGISSVAGPRSGDFFVGIRDFPEMHRIVGYDEYSYYGRIICSLFEPIETDHLIITQAPELPKVKLLKGETDTNPRQGRFAHLITSAPGSLF